jgi:hypothetical protein
MHRDEFEYSPWRTTGLAWLLGGWSAAAVAVAIVGSQRPEPLALKEWFLVLLPFGAILSIGAWGRSFTLGRLRAVRLHSDGLSFRDRQGTWNFVGWNDVAAAEAFEWPDVDSFQRAGGIRIRTRDQTFFVYRFLRRYEEFLSGVRQHLTITSSSSS